MYDLYIELVVLVKADPIDQLRVVGLPSIPFRPQLLGALRVSFCFLPEPCAAADLSELG
jgi:hypothetical protein